MWSEDEFILVEIILKGHETPHFWFKSTSEFEKKAS